MISFFRYFLLCSVLVALSFWGKQVRAQGASEASFTQVTRPVAQLTNEAAINELLEETLITPQIPRDSISRVEVIDVTENGFGPDDLVVVYPGGSTYTLNASMVTGRVEEIMSDWVLESEFRNDAAIAPPSTFRPDTARADTVQADTVQTQPRLPRDEWAEYGITADILETVQRNYQGGPLSILLEKDSEGFTIEMWGYNTQAMEHQAPPAGPPDTVRTRDLVYVVRSDSVIYDVVYINKTVKETEYVPQGPTSAVPSETGSGTGEARDPEATAPERR